MLTVPITSAIALGGLALIKGGLHNIRQGNDGWRRTGLGLASIMGAGIYLFPDSVKSIPFGWYSLIMTALCGGGFLHGKDARAANRQELDGILKGSISDKKSKRHYIDFLEYEDLPALKNPAMMMFFSGKNGEWKEDFADKVVELQREANNIEESKKDEEKQKLIQKIDSIFAEKENEMDNFREIMSGNIAGKKYTREYINLLTNRDLRRLEIPNALSFLCGKNNESWGDLGSVDI